MSRAWLSRGQWLSARVVTGEVLPRPAVAAAPGVTAVALSWPPLVHRTELVRGGSGGPAVSVVAGAVARA